jgi:hypothetical protein
VANVLLLHLDGGEDWGYPNLALMQIYAHHVAIGDRVELRNLVSAPADLHPRLGDPTWDRVYGSLIFERSRPLAEEARRLYPDIELGGTGWDFQWGIQVRRTDLPPEVAALAPHYGGYPTYKPSIGFTHRGCRLQCEHCVVPRKEGKVVSTSSLREIWRGDRFGRKQEGRCVLLDNDFFGNPQWPDVIAEAIELRIAIAVIQGINARMLSEPQAAAVASVRWMAEDFSRRRIYTAWDLIGDERTFFRGMNRLKAAGVSPDSIMVYMLIGFAPGETHADRDHRRQLLRDFGARPYPMPFVRDGELGDELCAFQSWCIQRKDEFVPWEKWWGKARGNVRKLGTRRVSLPLFPDEES